MDEETMLTDSAPYGQDDYSENDQPEYEGTEYAGDTEPEEFAELEAEPGEPNAATDSGAAWAQPEYQPYLPATNPFVTAIRDEYGDERLASLIEGALNYAQSQSSVAQSYQQSYIEQARSVAPEWVQKHSATIARAQAQITDPNLKGTVIATGFALLAPAHDYLQKTGDIAGFVDMVSQIKGKSHTPQAPAARKPVTLPPQMRTPSPSGGGNAGVRQAQVQAQQRQPRQSSAMKYLTESLGANPDDAQRFLQEH